MEAACSILFGAAFKKGWQKKAHQIYIYLFCAIVLGFWVVWGWDYAATVLSSPRRTTAWKIPFYVNQLPITVGLFGMALYSVYHLICNFIKKPSEYVLGAKYADEDPACGEETEGDEEQ